MRKAGSGITLLVSSGILFKNNLATPTEMLSSCFQCLAYLSFDMPLQRVHSRAEVMTALLFPEFMNVRVFLPFLAFSSRFCYRHTLVSILPHSFQHPLTIFCHGMYKDTYQFLYYVTLRFIEIVLSINITLSQIKISGWHIEDIRAIFLH